jgi:OOP family OmpA-OmpF porin
MKIYAVLTVIAFASCAGITDAQTPLNATVTKAYNNYDFIAGDTVLFEDNFMDDQEAEFPAHWNLGAGQAVMNTTGGQKALLLTDGNFAHISPLIKSPIYFADAFTIEFDWYFNGSYGPHIYFYSDSKDAKAASNPIGSLSLDHEAAAVTVESAAVDLSSPFADDIKGESHYNTWHHVALAYKKNQLKVYIDQYRVLVVPNLGIAPHAFDIEAIGDMNTPVVLTNFRLASCAGMNMLGKKFTDTKIVTHGIHFDVNQAVIKPESMGVLNAIIQVMKGNPEIKFEVGGHTDSDGDEAANQTLSQARADAVRIQLISMGIDGNRLTAKGYGETKPMADNKTFEGKANNRRVEFVKY